APILAGGTGTTSPLTLRSRTGTGTTGADIIFQVGTNGGTEAARILNSGFMGVGTATPGFVFQSGGTAAAGNFNALGVLNNATNASTSCTLLFTNSTSH